jgi:apolipoprotein N-acyltransferase
MKWYRSTLAIALLGSLLMWAAQPPLAWGWLAWIAPVPWLLLVRVESLSGRRPYGALWLAGFAFWLAAIQWLRLPHPAVYLGWLALSAYLAVYLPVFVGLARVAVHRLRMPLWLAAPVVWTGLELARAYLLTGFLMASLAHTQVRWTALIQLSDLVGEYGVDFLVMAVAASLTECGLRIVDCGFSSLFRNPKSAIRNWISILAPLMPAALFLTAALLYGYWRLGGFDLPHDNSPPGPRVALIQGNSLADWKSDTAKQQQIMNEYIGLSQEAVRKAQELDGRPIDMIVWPETMFRSPLLSFDPEYKLPPDADRTTDEIAAVGPRDLASLVRELGTPVLVGIDRVRFLADDSSRTGPPRYHAYNSAVFVDRDGDILGTYDKVHRVMFGEYIPFADWFPFLYGMTPLTGGIQPGAGPVVVEVGGTLYAPNICYETAIPRVIRRQAATRLGGSAPPQVLVNLTNDAWYWGSSELDMHLACDVFRAVENRKPLLVAANGGISAWIDRLGRVRAQSPRQQADVILADFELYHDTAPTLYVKTGDWFAAACLTCCAVLAIIGWRSRRVAP